MTLPSSGPISLSMIRAELGLSGPIDLDMPAVRALAGKPAGPIAFSDFYGKSAHSGPVVPPNLAYIQLWIRNQWTTVGVGLLITDSWLVCPASIIVGYGGNLRVVFVNDNTAFANDKSDSNVSIMFAEAVFSHENFYPPFVNDVGLIKLAGVVAPNFTPWYLSDNWLGNYIGQAAEMQCLAFPYGGAGSNSDISDTGYYYAGDITTVIPNSDAKNRMYNVPNDYINDWNICTFADFVPGFWFSSGGMRTIALGSPLIINGNLVGILGWYPGYPDSYQNYADPNIPFIYTDLFYQNAWIKNIVSNY